jgi:hypothetical protein
MTERYRRPEVESASAELIDELVIVAAEFASRNQFSLNVGAASAVLAGVRLLLRQAEPHEVVGWLDELAESIEVTGAAPQLGRLPAYRLRLIAHDPPARPIEATGGKGRFR